MAPATTTRPPTKAQRRARDIRTVRWARRVTQLCFAGLILVVAVRHQVESASGQPSVDAVCPFGAVETLITWATTGAFISRIHPSNLVLGLAILVATLLVGNAFCGWICPFGAVQDALAALRRRLKLPAFAPPRALDRVLPWGRFVVLFVVLWFSVTTAKLWFADYDPYVQLFGLHWLFAPDPATMWVGWAIVAVVAGLSLLVERAWCRYLCPLGAVFADLGRFSFLRIRRAPSACTDCTLCDRPCPVGIAPSKAQPFVSTDCIGCMDCVTTCPVPGALRLNAPVLLGFPVTKDAELAPRARREPGAANQKDN